MSSPLAALLRSVSEQTVSEQTLADPNLVDPPEPLSYKTTGVRRLERQEQVAGAAAGLSRRVRKRSRRRRASPQPPPPASLCRHREPRCGRRKRAA